ncbi:hypothetical protein PFISCL1PPCAC_27873, partial [Pristionchus fissidentatus]
IRIPIASNRTAMEQWKANVRYMENFLDKTRLMASEVPTAGVLAEMAAVMTTIVKYAVTFRMMKVELSNFKTAVAALEARDDIHQDGIYKSLLYEFAEVFKIAMESIKVSKRPWPEETPAAYDLLFIPRASRDLSSGDERPSISTNENDNIPSTSCAQNDDGPAISNNEKEQANVSSAALDQVTSSTSGSQNDEVNDRATSSQEISQAKPVAIDASTVAESIVARKKRKVAFAVGASHLSNDRQDGQDVKPLLLKLKSCAEYNTRAVELLQRTRKYRVKFMKDYGSRRSFASLPPISLNPESMIEDFLATIPGSRRMPSSWSDDVPRIASKLMRNVEIKRMDPSAGPSEVRALFTLAAMLEFLRG